MAPTAPLGYTTGHKPMNGISPNFGHRCIWVHRSKVKVAAGNDPPAPNFEDLTRVF